MGICCRTSHLRELWIRPRDRLGDMTFLALAMSAALQYSVSPDSAFELPPPSARSEPRTQAYPDYPSPDRISVSRDTTRWSKAPQQVFDGAVYGTLGGTIGCGIGFIAGMVYASNQETPCGTTDGRCGLGFGTLVMGLYGAGIGGTAGISIGMGIGVSGSSPRSYPSRTPIPGILGAAAGLAVGFGVAYGAESPALAPLAMLVGAETGALVMDRTLARNNSSPRLTAGYLRPGLPGARLSMAF